MSRYSKPRYQDICGRKFNRLLVLELLPQRSASGGTVWLCRCDCGTIVKKRAQDLHSRHTLSCGCQLREKAAEHLKKVRTTNGRLFHGHASRNAHSQTYNSWKGAKNRCFNINEPAWFDYGGRGISMCARWKNSFAAFLTDMGECPPGKSLDRFPNNNGDYEPGNCRWATVLEQRMNQRPRNPGIAQSRTKWRPEERIEALSL